MRFIKWIYQSGLVGLLFIASAHYGAYVFEAVYALGILGLLALWVPYTIEAGASKNRNLIMKVFYPWGDGCCKAEFGVFIFMLALGFVLIMEVVVYYLLLWINSLS